MIQGSPQLNTGSAVETSNLAHAMHGVVLHCAAHIHIRVSCQGCEIDHIAGTLGKRKLTAQPVWVPPLDHSGHRRHRLEVECLMLVHVSEARPAAPRAGLQSTRKP
jgi:hypothetical protein